ncbi:MAG TPA: N-acetyl-gamma-glutamyl-phosphate reductase [Desulfobacteria bacterium]|nr:N-acetyl-gamma-glutamyl-phosphate reductase [Desulfobacteria bacterium]
MIKVGIVGSTGYTGVELVRLLSNHPNVEIKVLSSHSYVGKRFGEVYPHSFSAAGRELADDKPENFAGVDQVILALPHGLSGALANELLPMGKKVIDLGADFRLNDGQVYQDWYKLPAPDNLAEAVYGLPELKREQIRRANLIANPGCFPTATILALAPALKGGIVAVDSLIVDAKSGVSGAGRSLSLGSHFSEVNENFKAYKVGTHRHTPEIEQELSLLAGEQITLSFTPHLVPMTRGILATVYGKLNPGWNEAKIRECYQEFYAQEQFVSVLEPGVLPQTKWVYGSNHCLINLVVDKRTNRLIILSVIDNLVKGAAGQAIQNLNLLWGLPENTGLTMLPLMP